jgi:hypothetical protein
VSRGSRTDAVGDNPAMREPGTHSAAAERWSRWRRRESTPAARWLWSSLYLGGFGLWLWMVHGWAQEPERSYLGYGSGLGLWGLVACLTYWPTGAVLWQLMYPADERLVPFQSE